MTRKTSPTQQVTRRSELAAAAVVRPAESTTVAVVGLTVGDQAALREILDCSECLRGPICQWNIRPEASVESVLDALECEPIAIVIFDRDSNGDGWKRLLDQFAVLPHPPMLIVASRLADDRLWAEALNLGAYDVMIKPFNAAEVVRIAGLACAQWRQRHAAPAVMHSFA